MGVAWFLTWKIGEYVYYIKSALAAAFSSVRAKASSVSYEKTGQSIIEFTLLQVLLQTLYSIQPE